MNHPESLVAIGWIITVVLAVGGWFFTAWRQRVLQRKQIAVELLNRNRFQSAWVEGQAAVFNKLNTEPNFDWASLAERHLGNGTLTDEELKSYHHLRIVLNFLEFIAIAVLNRAADENIIRWALQSQYQRLDSGVKKFIIKVREKAHSEEIYINLTTLAEKWRKKPSYARPTA